MVCLQRWSVPAVLEKTASLSLLFAMFARFVVTVRSYWVNFLCTYRGSSVDSRRDASV